MQPAGPVGGSQVVRLAPRPPFLAGREDLLAELEARLGGGDGRGRGWWRCTGWPVPGRPRWRWPTPTLTARKAGSRGSWRRRTRRCWWRGSPSWPPRWAPGRGGDPVVAVHGALAGAAGWLLVFDNAPGPEAVAALVPPVGDGRVLITSRNALWPPGQGLEVPVLDLEAAAGFLAARTGDADRQAAAGLAEAVGGLPLALEQAAAYAQATGNSLAAYLALFHQRRADLLARGQVPGYGGTVATTWALAFGQLQDSAPGAAGLLRLLAFCAPEAVPLRLLLAAAARAGRTAEPGSGAGCWPRCWMMSWPPGMRSRRCAGTRWSARPGTGRCRCTGWCRRSPPTRCPMSCVRRGGRPPPP